MEGHATVAAAKQSSLSKLQEEASVSATLDNQYLLETEHSELWRVLIIYVHLKIKECCISNTISHEPSKNCI
jgi:hypothetical protein